MTPTILVLNAGSSSIKFQLFAVSGDTELERRIKGQMEGIGTRPRLLAKSSDGSVLVDETSTAAQLSGVPAALDRVVAFLRENIGGRLPTAIGHRVVHGGPQFSEPTLVNPAVLNELERLTPLAPLHQPHNVGLIRLILNRQPQLPQVACFDTAFHRGHPEVADRYAIPEPLYAEGVRRYGFHGLSYEYIARRLHQVAPKVANGRVVVAHLGSGASMCAIVGGKSVESTMGFTALDGIPMGTRPGQIDPGVLLYLLTERGMDPEAVQDLLYRESGLKGLSGISNDMRDLESSADPAAALAVDYFVYRVGLHAGMLAAALGGLDAFVFTAGIGENSVTIRARIAEKLAWLGVAFDAGGNAARASLISKPESRVALYVVPTDEELMIARHTLALLPSRSARAAVSEKLAG